VPFTVVLSGEPVEPSKGFEDICNPKI